MSVEQVLEFWLDQVGPEGWYNASPDLDRQIHDQFYGLWSEIMQGKHGMWLTYPSGALAYIIVTDQFSRNMFRGTGQSFASDRIALCAAKSSIGQDWDTKIDPPARQFFYMPLMHSENLSDQERCVRLMKSRLTQDPSNLIHAQVHRQVIRQFGRFPYRNQALDRKDTQPEIAYLAAGGYSLTYQQMKAAISA